MSGFVKIKITDTIIKPKKNLKNNISTAGRVEDMLTIFMNTVIIPNRNEDINRRITPLNLAVSVNLVAGIKAFHKKSITVSRTFRPVVKYSQDLIYLTK